MNEVRSIAALSPGAPHVDGLAWHEAHLETKQRVDPFSGRSREFKTWVPGALAAGDRADERARIDLAISSAWSVTVQGLDRAFHDGFVFELWVSVLGAKEALPLWRPQWVAGDGSMLFAFPPAVIEWRRRANSGELRRVSAVWADQPYLESAAVADGAIVAATFLGLLGPIVDRVVLGDTVFALTSPRLVQP